MSDPNPSLTARKQAQRADLAKVTEQMCRGSRASPVSGLPSSCPCLHGAWEALSVSPCFLCLPSSPLGGLSVNPALLLQDTCPYPAGLPLLSPPASCLWPWPLLQPRSLIQSRGPNVSTQVAKTKVRKSPEDTLLEVSASIHRRKEPGAPS